MAVLLTEADLSAVERQKRMDQVLCYVSGSAAGLKQAKESGFRFIAATWGSEPADTFKGETCMSSPEELIDIISKH